MRHTFMVSFFLLGMPMNFLKKIDMWKGYTKKAITSLVARMSISVGFLDDSLLYGRLCQFCAFVWWVRSVYIPAVDCIFSNIGIGDFPSTLLFDLQFLYVCVDVFEGSRKVNRFCVLKPIIRSYFPPSSCLFKCRKFFCNIWSNTLPFIHISTLCSLFWYSLLYFWPFVIRSISQSHDTCSRHVEGILYCLTNIHLFFLNKYAVVCLYLRWKLHFR